MSFSSLNIANKCTDWIDVIVIFDSASAAKIRDVVLAKFI